MSNGPELFPEAFMFPRGVIDRIRALMESTNAERAAKKESLMTLGEAIAQLVEFAIVAVEPGRGLQMFDDSKPVARMTVRELAAAVGYTNIVEARQNTTLAKENAAAAMAETLRVFKDAKVLKVCATPKRFGTPFEWAAFAQHIADTFAAGPPAAALVVAIGWVDTAENFTSTEAATPATKERAN